MFNSLFPLSEQHNPENHEKKEDQHTRPYGYHDAAHHNRNLEYDSDQVGNCDYEEY